MLKPRRRWLVLVPTALAALVACSAAWAHAEVSPPVVLAGADQVFTLAVPTEEEGAFTTKVELTVPDGFSIDSFVPAAGWKRDVQQTGSGENTTVQSVTWSGGHVPTEEDALFQFIGAAENSGSISFQVRQTYSDGKVVDWTGAADSDTPAPTIEAKKSLGGGGSSSTLAIVALVLGAAGVALGIVALVTRGGGREMA